MIYNDDFFDEVEDDASEEQLSSVPITGDDLKNRFGIGLYLMIQDRPYKNDNERRDCCVKFLRDFEKHIREMLDVYFDFTECVFYYFINYGDSSEIDYFMDDDNIDEILDNYKEPKDTRIHITIRTTNNTLNLRNVASFVNALFCYRNRIDIYGDVYKLSNHFGFLRNDDSEDNTYKSTNMNILLKSSKTLETKNVWPYEKLKMYLREFLHAMTAPFPDLKFADVFKLFKKYTRNNYGWIYYGDYRYDVERFKNVFDAPAGWITDFKSDVGLEFHGVELVDVDTEKYSYYDITQINSQNTDIINMIKQHFYDSHAQVFLKRQQFSMSWSIQIVADGFIQYGDREFCAVLATSYDMEEDQAERIAAKLIKGIAEYTE